MKTLASRKEARDKIISEMIGRVSYWYEVRNGNRDGLDEVEVNAKLAECYERLRDL